MSEVISQNESHHEQGQANNQQGIYEQEDHLNHENVGQQNGDKQLKSEENLDQQELNLEPNQGEDDKINVKGGKSISVISGGDQEDQENYLKQNSIQYFDEHDKNSPNTQRSQIQHLDQSQKHNDMVQHYNKENKIRSSSNYNQSQGDQKSIENDDINLSAHLLNKSERELILKQNNNAKVIISGMKSSRESQNGQGSIMTPKKKLSIQRLSINKSQNGEESVEKQLLQMNDANEITKQSNSGEKNSNEQHQNNELIKLRSQNDKLREELKALSDKLSVVIEKNQKNIAGSKGRLNNQSSDSVLKQELNNAYKLIDAIQKDNKKLQSQVYDGGHFEKVMKLENDLKSKDQEVKMVKKELELTKKLHKITAAQEEDKREVHVRKDDFNEKYALKQQIKELKSKLSDQDDKFNKQYREFLSMEKEYKKLCEKNNLKPNFVYNENDNTFERSPKPHQSNLISRDRKSGSLLNNPPKRSESLRPLDRSRLTGNNHPSDQQLGSNAALLSQNQLVDPEFQNIDFNETNFYELLQKAKVYKKSKATTEKKLNNELNELKNILSQKNQEIIQLKQQLLNRDRQSNNLQSQLNQIKRQKQNINEQQSYNPMSITDNNISIDENDNQDNSYIPGADQTNNSIQYATPIKQERQIPKKKLLPQTSNLKNKSRSPNQKSSITQSDSHTSRKLISNPSTNIPYSNQNHSPGKQSIKSPKKPLPFSIGNNEQSRGNFQYPQQSNYEPNINSSRSPQQKKQGANSVQSSQSKPLNPSSSSQRQQLSNKQLSKKSNVNQSVEEFDSYSPTRFQNDDKNVPIQNNMLLQQSNMNKDEIVSSNRNISPQQQVLIPLTLRDVQIGMETEDSFRFTDRITLKQNYHHKIVYVQVIHDDKGVIGIQCNYRLQKTSQIIQGEMHIIQNQNANIINSEESQVQDEFNVDENGEGDYIKYVQGSINAETNQIVNLIFVTAKGYRKILGLQNLKNDDNLQSFNMEISENEVPICLYGSLQKVYGDNENPIGSMLTQIGFNVERDDYIEENIKAFYAEDDQVRTEFEQNQRQQELKKKNNNNSTKFIREDNPTSERFSQNGSQSNIQYLNQENPMTEREDIPNKSNYITHQIDEVPQSQQESPHFKAAEHRAAQTNSIHPIQIVNQSDEIHNQNKKTQDDGSNQIQEKPVSQQQSRSSNRTNKSKVIVQKEDESEFTLSNLRKKEGDHSEKHHNNNLLQPDTNSPKNQINNKSGLPSSRNSRHEAQHNKNDDQDQYQIKVKESLSRNTNSPRGEEQNDGNNHDLMNKLHTEVSNIEKNPSSLTQRSNQSQQNKHTLQEVRHDDIQQNKSQQSHYKPTEEEQKVLHQNDSKNEFVESQPQSHRQTIENHSPQQDNHDIKVQEGVNNEEEQNQQVVMEDRAQQTTIKYDEEEVN